jgi:hypothetical protein
MTRSTTGARSRRHGVWFGRLDRGLQREPFERRLRDIHAGTQRGQGRPIDFETVGQVLLGLPRQGRMFR